MPSSMGAVSPSMPTPRSLLLDTNVWLDYLLGADEPGAQAKQLIMRCIEQDIPLLYAPTSLKDVFYILPRRLRMRSAAGEPLRDESLRPIAWACVRIMTELGVAAPQSLPECNLAWMLRHEHSDFEDNLVMAAAETSNAGYVVTSDKAMLDHYAPSCITPSQALRLLARP